MKKNCLLLGRRGINIPLYQQNLQQYGFNLFSGTNPEEVKHIFAQTDIDIVIMGAGIPLEDRLSIIKYIFTISEKTTIHMKDWQSGPAGMQPFVKQILDSYSRIGTSSKS